LRAVVSGTISREDWNEIWKESGRLVTDITTHRGEEIMLERREYWKEGNCEEKKRIIEMNKEGRAGERKEIARMAQEKEDRATWTFWKKPDLCIYGGIGVNCILAIQTPLFAE